MEYLIGLFILIVCFAMGCCLRVFWLIAGVAPDHDYEDDYWDEVEKYPR